MKDERTHHGTMDKSLSEQQICVSVLISCIVRKNDPILLLLVGLTAGRQATSQAGRQNTDVSKFLKFSTFWTIHALILYNIIAMLLQY